MPDMKTRLLTLSITAALTSVAFAQGGATQPGSAPAAQAANAAPATPKALAALQGTWVLTSADGEDLTGGPEIALTITDDKYVQTVNGDIQERGQIKLDEAKKPIRIDLIIQEGNDAGKTQLGVIDVTGTSLKGKLNSPGDNVRPTDFEPADGFFTFVAVKK
jgi:uncharacterized protein (TIGR03067 family)